VPPARSMCVLGSPAVPTLARSTRPLAGLAALALALGLLAACGKDSPATATSTTTTTVAPTPSEVLASCSPAEGSEFVAIEKHHLTNGAQHLGQGFVSPAGPGGVYLSANVYDVNNQLLATALTWRIGPDGTAMSATPETDAWDSLPDVPAAENVPHPELVACAKAALAAG
jgi:hypothetical protein